MIIKPTSFTSPIIKVAATPRVVGINITEVPRIITAAHTVEITDKDRIISRAFGAAGVIDLYAIPDVFGGVARTSLTPTIDPPNVGIIRPNFLIEHAQDGLATLTFSGEGFHFSKDIEIRSFEANVKTSFVSHLDATLSKHISTYIDSRLIGKDATTALQLFSSLPISGGAYTRNANVWVSDSVSALSCHSVWNSAGGFRRGGVMLSPRHVAFAAHYPVGVGSTMHFVSATGALFVRTVTARLTHPDYSSGKNPPVDISVAVLDSDLPESVSFARVLPDNWEAYLPTQNKYLDGGVPCVVVDSNKHATVGDLRLITDSWNSFGIPTDTVRRSFYRTKVSGDSGSPMFLLINEQAVLLAMLTYTGSGSPIQEHKAAINTMMTQLGGGYQLTEIDLSGFTSFA